MLNLIAGVALFWAALAAAVGIYLLWKGPKR